MKYVFQINHPAHYHLIKNILKELKSHGHETYIVARGKDVLENLLEGEDYIMLKSKKGMNLLQKFLRKRNMEKEIVDTVRSIHPDAVIGTGPFGKVSTELGINTFFFAEDDLNLNFMIFLSGLGYYRFTEILSPIGCNNLFWNKKTTNYAGFQKLAYLHPNRFTPNRKVVEKYFDSDNKYFILRFAQLNAYHDIGVSGINTEIAQRIIDILSPFGNVYITSERPLEPQFEKFRLHINPKDIHHVLSFACMLIGDSQSMAVESAMLGTPSIRFNDFAGKISVLEELEHKYGLTFGIPSSEPQQLYDKIEELLAMPNLREEFQTRRQRMLADKIDVTAFFTWFIENYPESKRIMKENPDYQYNFK